jgi:RIO kinase 1
MLLIFWTDFTKQYNRMKQHLAVQAGSGSVSTTKAANTKQPKTVASLPAVNKPRAAQAVPTKLSHQQQLDSLSKYSSKIANIDMPYMLRAGVNPKGASQTANLKDKSDRATNEQVLDPRTRIILFKMIGRGLVSEINGCVSTGKEVRTPVDPHSFAHILSGQCIPCAFTVS